MNKIILVLLLLLLTSCVDKSKAIDICSKEGLQNTGKTFGCSIECVNTTTGELKVFADDGKIDILCR